MGRSLLYRFVVFVAAIPLLLLNSCDESLPPRGDPTDFLSTTVRVDYSKNNGDHPEIYVMVSVRNMYSESFSDTGAVSGTITLEWKDNPQFQKHAKISSGNITQVDPSGAYIGTGYSYDYFRNVLTLPKGSAVNFLYYWDMRTDEGRNTSRYFHYAPDPYDGTRAISDPETFVVSASVRLFKDTPFCDSQPVTLTRVYTYQPPPGD